ncbi:MAG: ATP-dependent DNA helicase UvrD2 [Candidatus Limnocylindrales bacterium]
MDPLAGLNDGQRAAVEATRGPVAILAGAGTGKTRVISHRVAHAVATGVVTPERVLLVTFTEKAAAEMVGRVRALGLPAVAARTFHAAALAQIRHYWPARHEGAPLPEILNDPFRLVAPLARRLPGGYTWTSAKDLIDELSWARSRRIRPDGYVAALGSRTPPVPAELFVRLWRDYEQAKSRAGVIDFDDMLTLTVELLETDEEAASQVRGRYTWFSVDEYQDTNPLQQRLLELWLGDRRDVCVVGDEDQTIYSFAGATPEFLNGFATRYPDARIVALTENYRSTPQVLALANRLIAATGPTKALTATHAAGPEPAVLVFDEGDAELDGLLGRVRSLMASGTPGREIAVLVRLNAQIPALEGAFTRANIPYQVRGQRFFERRDVRSAIEALSLVPTDAVGPAVVPAVLATWSKRLGFEEGGEAVGGEARERQAALTTLLSIIESQVDASPATGRESVIAALASRARDERQGSADGVELLTFHRAKGLEWDAVFLPSLEEGLLPVAQAKEDETLIDEERRLLYVGLTRARVHLTLSWARGRAGAHGKIGRRYRSRFLGDIVPAPARKVLAGAPMPRQLTLGANGTAAGSAVDGDPRMLALRNWRTERARADRVPPYVIAHDSTLAAIVERRPASMTALARVPGIGPAKLEKYGAEILATLGTDPT